MNDAVPLDYASLLREVKQRIRAAQLAALCQVNRERVGLYADIGRLIVSRQEGETWGKRVVANLARDLQSEFPAAAGFSAANLWRMKLFHETYGADEKLAPLVREIGWSHNVVILELSAAHSERELERALTAHVEEFLREMGGKFAFVGSQHRLSVGGRDYFLDLLLYHRRLGALVAIELKVAEFEPEYVGKMQFYLAALDDAVRLEGEAPAGIILCKSKNRTVVEYALRRAPSPIGVATYEVTSSPPPGLETELPRPDQVAKLLDQE